MTTSTDPSCTAFLGARRVAFGSYAAVAQALSSLGLSGGGELLVFDDATGAQVDHPWPPGYPATPSAAAAEPVAAAAPQVGRPRMGVVAREVTLLPRHWEWLAQQPGGASAALRRLVEEARRTHAERDGWRQAKERAYRFMSAIAGGFAGFEEASRALFGQDAEAFARSIADWPPDVQSHLAWLARNAFAPEAAAPSA
ncbi:DUF2239 family protein [Hydrogenophaga sp. BPS33]|uniref:DUF2239 family protein n=1 Tax=Hydrogenophaga sp. BPS33 TaxID=2651974 RepID=UPI00131F70BA|nr:DUF2239 family protein [Hydrogenophaga sp. BPS33]QHE87862.1 DUF2239 family protein [Hydrogenophaga sp. BPS33]